MAAAPTGCFKCGRPGHWSRDCPSSSSSTGPKLNPNPNPNFSRSETPFANSKFSSKTSTNTSNKTPVTADGTDLPSKKKSTTRPKLTPDLLLSDVGLGYVLKHFPRGFKYRGRGHEVSDLGNLIELYAQWHSHLIPYYSFDQFIKKVEQVGSTKRVRRCINELCERVARGGDPTKLHESPVEDGDGTVDPSLETPAQDPMDLSLETPVSTNVDEEMLNEFYQNTTNEASTQNNIFNEINPNLKNQEVDNNNNNNNNNNGVKKARIELSEEQRARMEANRLKALERAKARALASQSSEIQS